MKLIVGLGNPGRKYSRHRHNIGFFVLDELGRRHDVSINKRSFKSLIGAGVISGVAVILVKPQTYMNLSGDSVCSLLGYYRLEPSDLIVVHDDIDLALGRIKMTKGSGDAGHRGVRSIIERIGTKDFVRFRLGVGRSSNGFDSADFVLSPFDKAEINLRDEMTGTASDEIEKFLLSP